MTAPHVGHLIVGAGQVGKALESLLGAEGRGSVAIRDVDPIDVTARMIHIAYPWSEGFVESVKADQTRHEAKIVVIHSTVPVGTCDPNDWVFSPIRGRHPYLNQSLYQFVKFFGGWQAQKASKPFTQLGVTVRIQPKAADLEAGKLWELAQYAVQILMEKTMFEYCQDLGLDHDVVYRQFAETYNNGYKRDFQDRFVRPVLSHKPGPIGGHCVIPGVKLLDDALANTILAWHEEVS